MANAIVTQNDAVTTRLMSVDAAIAEGAMALFGEKYGEEVRVVSMGRNAAGAEKPIYSLELCGGTHVQRTGDIGLIKVVSEGAVAAGVRRIEALAGEAAKAYLDGQDKLVGDAAALLKVSSGQLLERLEALVEERKRLEKELADVKKQQALSTSKPTTEMINGVAFSFRIINGLDAQELKPLALSDLKALGSGIVANVAVSDTGTASVVTAVSSDLAGKHDAVALVRAASAAVGGKGGGGKPDLAQAGGPDGSRASHAIAAVRATLS
jgi:alanyl-tRNA synthetase